MPEEKVYNHDLLVNPGDVEWLELTYPEVAWIADDPCAREKFRGKVGSNGDAGEDGYDGRANTAKSWSTRCGATAIILATLALIMVAAEPLLHTDASAGAGGSHAHCGRILGGVAAALGFVGGLIGAVGLLYGRNKDKWLRNRVLTERIRQSYFQFFVRRTCAILAAQSLEDRGALVAERERLWERFRRDYENSAPGWVGAISEDEEERELWMVPPEPAGGALSAQAPSLRDAEMLLAFYREQRFQKQADYARHVLRSASSVLSRAPRWQAGTIADIAFVCVAGLLTTHLVLAGTSAFGVEIGASATWLHVAALWLAIIALSAKTFEEGLRPEHELERMRAYNWGVRKILEKFDKTTSLEGKISAMEEMESLSYWELREFLRDQLKARFSM